MKKQEDCCQLKITLNTVAAANMNHCVSTHRHSANATNMTAKILFALSSSDSAKCFTLGTGVDNEN